jgi:hypothetical protein
MMERKLVGVPLAILGLMNLGRSSGRNVGGHGHRGERIMY